MKTFIKMLLVVLFVGVFFSESFAYEIRVQENKGKKIGYGDWYIDTDGEFLLLKQILKPGQIVLDVGANTGDWSKHALLAEPSILLHSFEPLPFECSQLKQNLSKYSNCKVWNCALSNSEGSSDFHYYCDTPEHSALSGFYYREVLRGDFHEPVIIKVQHKSLETFCKQEGIQKIDFVKIDTEGSEWNILVGAKGLIENKQITAIQFEYGGCYVDAKTKLEDVFKLLKNNGYLVFRIFEKGLVFVNEWDSYLEDYDLSNWFAIRNEAYKCFFPSHKAVEKAIEKFERSNFK